jgi:PDZ domain
VSSSPLGQRSLPWPHVAPGPGPGSGRAAALGLILLPAVLAACAAAPAPATAPPSAPPAATAPPPPPVARPDTERWSGVVVEPVTEALARAANVPRVEGLYVRDVEPGSPADRAGIRRGDVLLLAAGVYLAAPEALPWALATAPVGGVVEVALRRAGELVTVKLPVETSPGGRLMTLITAPGGLVQIAADGGMLYGFGAVPGGADVGIVPLQLPGGPMPAIAPRAVASPGAERVIAADAERVFLGWAGSEIYIDYYEIGSGRVGRLPVLGAESLANRCRPRGLTRVGGELWMACQRPDGAAIVRIDLGSGQARLQPLPGNYWAGLAFDGEAVLWLCCVSGGRPALARTDLASGTTRVFPLPEAATSVAADPEAVYLLAPPGIFQHKPWR